MGSLGELYFALGLDDKKFNDAIEEAKRKVAELTGEAVIDAKVNTDKVASEVAKSIGKLESKGKVEIKAEVSKESLRSVAELEEDLRNTRLELEKLESAKVKNTSAINDKKGYIGVLERQLVKAKEAEKAVEGVAEAVQEVAQASSSVHHIFDEGAIEEVKNLTTAMSGLNAQMEVANRLRELQSEKSKGKGRVDYEREAKWAAELREEYEKEGRGGTTADYESISYKRAQNLLKKEFEEQERIAKELEKIAKEEKKLEEKAEAAKRAKEARNAAISKQISIDAVEAANSIGRQSPEIKSLNQYYRKLERSTASDAVKATRSNKAALEENLRLMQRLEEAIKKLQQLRVSIDTSGIDKNSDAYRDATRALDDYIDKLQKMQSAGGNLNARKVNGLLGQDMSSTTQNANKLIRNRIKLEEELAKLRKKGVDVDGIDSLDDLEELNDEMETSFDLASQLKGQFMDMFSIYSLEGFIRNLYTIGGEFQKQQIALENMIGDSTQASAIFERIKNLAVKSPFTFSELASYTKQMSAYGIEYEELYDTTKRLADISAGVGVDMGRLILAYGQVRSAEVLRGQELRQFTEAGIPLVAELAKRLEEVRGTSVKVGEVFDAISRREVSFGMVKDVLFDMTDPGGRFFEAQERLADSLAGKWSNLQDAWEIMIAGIAQDNNSVLGDAVELLTELTRHWKEIVPAIFGAAAAMGAFQISVNAASISTSAFIATLNKHPLAAFLGVLAGLTATAYGYIKNVDSITERNRKLSSTLEANAQKAKENEQVAHRYLETLKSTNIQEEHKDRLYKELHRMYPNLFDEMNKEKNLLEDLAILKGKVTEATKKQTEADYDEVIAKAKKNTEAARLTYETTPQKKEAYMYTPEGKWEKYETDNTEALEKYKKEWEDAEKKVLDLEEEKRRFLKAAQDFADKKNAEDATGWREIAKALISEDSGIVMPKEDELIDEYFDYLEEEFNNAKSKFERYASKDLKDPQEKLMKQIDAINVAIGGVSLFKKEGDGKPKSDTKDAGARAAKSFADGAKEEVSKIAKRWNLYRQLFEITGDKKFAMSAFKITPVWDEDATQMLNRLENLMSEEGIEDKLEFDISDSLARVLYGDFYDSWKEIKDKIEQNGINIKVNAATAIRDARTVKEKINAELNKKEEALKSYQIGTPEYEAVAAGFDKTIQDLKTNLWELSPAFKSVFKDTVGMSISQIERLKGETKDIIDAIGKGTKNDKTGKTDFSYNGEDYSISEEGLNKLIELLDKLSEKSNSLGESFKRVWSWISGKEYKDQGKLKFGDIAGDLAGIAEAASGAAQSLSTMFDSLGNESLADDLELAGNLLGSVGDIGKGLASGDPFAVVGGIAGAITSIAQHHDKKLDRAIQKSQLEVKKLSNAYKNLESDIERQLGSATAGQAAKMIDNLSKQRSELEKQYEAEDDKKKTDKSKLEDYKQQIAELDDQLKYFYEDLAKEQYNADIKGWAGEIASALTQAFASGEDAAEAFDKTVGGILQNLATEAIRMQFIEPAMASLRDYMFGDKGIFTLGSESGTDLSANEAVGLSKELEKLKGQVAASNEYWDKINEATGGLLESTESSKSGLSKNIQGVTEDTANLLGSYLNSIRQEVSVKRSLIEQLVNEAVPKINYLAEAQLQQLQMVVANTKRNADAADKIYDLVNRVVDKGSNKLKV